MDAELKTAIRWNWSSLLHIQASPFACGAKCAIGTEYRYGVKFIPEGKEERSEVARLRQILNPFEEAAHGSVGSKSGPPLLLPLQSQQS